MGRTTKNREPKGGLLYVFGFNRFLYREYKRCLKKERKGEALTASEKTHLYGYLKPWYRSAY